MNGGVLMYITLQCVDVYNKGYQTSLPFSQHTVPGPEKLTNGVELWGVGGPKSVWVSLAIKSFDYFSVSIRLI